MIIYSDIPRVSCEHLLLVFVEVLLVEAELTVPESVSCAFDDTLNGLFHRSVDGDDLRGDRIEPLNVSPEDTELWVFDGCDGVLPFGFSSESFAELVKAVKDDILPRHNLSSREW